MLKLIVSTLIVVMSLPSWAAFSKKQFVGDWCLYEQQWDALVVEENATVSLNKNGSYVWKEQFWDQQGSWFVNADGLSLTQMEIFQIISVTESEMKLRRGSILKFRKGACAESEE